MMLRKISTFLLFVVLSPTVPFAQTIEAQWDEYIPPEGYEVAGFALQRNGRIIALFNGAEITTGEVDGPDVRPGEAFELRVIFVDGRISPKSLPYVIDTSAGRFIRIKSSGAGRVTNGSGGVSLQ